jgi:predicted Rossmann-fold nucleotide-binding protein
VEAWLAALPGADALLFWPPPAQLYTPGDLYDGLRLGEPETSRHCWDARVYRWTLGPNGKPRSLDDVETVATRLHDAAMDRLVRDYVDAAHHVTIGFMGGHDVARTEAAYEQVARTAREMRRRGFKIVTGGGPGLMEAANFGAMLAPHTDEDLDASLQLLRTAPDFGISESQTDAWIHTAAQVRDTLLGRWNAPPLPGGDSLGLPTWYYGAEPPNLFASVSGKYFMNSLREDGLVSIANGGLVFAKGAAGTVQEVFQNAGYNYYRGAGVEATPMVFLGRDFWNPGPDADAGAPRDPKRKPVYPLVAKLAADADLPFAPAVMLTDDPEAIVEFLSIQNESQLRARQADIRLAQVNSLPSPRSP